jgi:hypothetical protein
MIPAPDRAQIILTDKRLISLCRSKIAHLRRAREKRPGAL